MARFLVDTDVFVDHLRGAARVPVAPADAGYSSITRAELYAGGAAEEPAIDLLLGAFEEVGVHREIAEEGGRLRRSGSITLPDALIAATATLGGSILVTRNVGDFAGIPGLRLHSP